MKLDSNEKSYLSVVIGIYSLILLILPFTMNFETLGSNYYETSIYILLLGLIVLFIQLLIYYLPEKK
jgi:hypothetical protein